MHTHRNKIWGVAGVIVILSMIASPASAHSTRIAWDCGTTPGTVTFYVGNWHTASEGPSGGMIIDNVERGSFTHVVSSLPAGVDDSVSWTTSTTSWQVVTVAGLTNGSHTVTTTSTGYVEAPYGSPLTMNLACVWNAPPVVSVAEVRHEATYEHGSVPDAGCLVVDEEDGTSTPDASVSAVSGPRADVGLGSQTAECSYTDAGGITVSASATYLIVDTTRPEITVPADQVVEATGPSGTVVTFDAPTATDAVDGPLTATCDHASGSSFEFGLTTVTCTASDGADNEVADTFTVTVQDKTAPVLTLPDDVTVPATSSSGAPVSYEVGASDVVDGTSAVECTPISGSVFAIGTTTVTCSTTDESGNPAEGTFDVTVTALPIVEDDVNQSHDDEGTASAGEGLRGAGDDGARVLGARLGRTGTSVQGILIAGSLFLIVGITFLRRSNLPIRRH